MCRIFAASDKMKKKDILELLLDMESRNTDGFGFAYTENKKLIVYKTKNSLSDSLKKKGKNNIFDFFPEKRKGWAIFHLRAATHGNISVRNAHPFVSTNYAWVHNGVFREHELVKSLLGKDIKYSSDVDSEVALYLFEKLGAKKFAKVVEGSSVYLALQRDGSLWAIKTTFHADLKIGQLTKKKLFLSSELPFRCKFEHEEAKDGWYYFNPDGTLNSHKEKDNDVIVSRSFYKAPKVIHSPYDADNYPKGFANLGHFGSSFGSREDQFANQYDYIGRSAID